MLDGVCVEDEGRTLRVRRAVPPTDEELDRLLVTIDRRIRFEGRIE